MTAREKIVAVRRNGRTRQRIAILEPPLPSPVIRGVDWIAFLRKSADHTLVGVLHVAYRHWDSSANYLDGPFSETD